MSDTIINSLIGAAQGITVALVGLLALRIGRVKKDTSAVREQVENDHSTNMREEQDARNRSMHHRFDTLASLVAGNSERLTSVEKMLREHDDDIDALENTLNPKRTKE